MQKYIEKYRGFTIQRIGDRINIYDKNGFYVKMVESRKIYAAKITIDEIINQNRKCF